MLILTIRTMTITSPRSPFSPTIFPLQTFVSCLGLFLGGKAGYRAALEKVGKLTTPQRKSCGRIL